MTQTIEVALIQSDLIWENPEKNRIAFSKKINQLSSDVDLIILPETFTSGFTMNPEKINLDEGNTTLDWMRKMAREKDAAIMGSIVFQDNKTFYNRLHFVYSDGTYEKYDKRHTFTLAGEDKVFKAGTEKLIVDYKGFKICPLICYDLRFPVWSRNTENYDIVIYIANWPKPRISAWNTLLKARAIENMAYCIGVNRIGFDENGLEYPGNSGVYDCLGKRLVFSEKEENITLKISKKHLTATRDKLKFLDDQDQFIFEL